MKNGHVYSLSALALLAGMSAVRAEEIRIAVAGPMTGAVASIGEQLKNGAELAAQAVNKNGGVNGNTIRIVVYDDPAIPSRP
jgi:branched-chain amino acid transport system substrate-binding protein